MAVSLPPPAVRQRVRLPLMLDGGRCVAASAISFTALGDEREHLALTFGSADRQPLGQQAPRVRIHSECLTGDVFGSARCDCGGQMRDAIRMHADEGGILLYLRQEGRGIGLYNKLDAYRLQEHGVDTFDANRRLAFAEDARDYGCAARMLVALGATRIRLLTNNPDKARQLARHGISVVEVLPTRVHRTPHNQAYLWAKQARAGHFLSLSESDEKR
jgi:GTP cyclohydrolase II